MTERAVSEPQAEHQAGHWDTLFASVNDLIRRRPHTSFVDDHGRAQPSLRDRVDRGLCAVPIYRITLGTPRDSLFEQWMPEPVKPPVHVDRPMQPVSLYKVADAYYVRDGNRRIASARSRGQMFLRAHVVEYSLDGPSHPPDVLAQLVAHERAEFFTRLYLPHSQAANSMRAELLGSYPHLSAHIAAVCEVLQRQGFSYEQAVLRWYDTLYAPVVRVIQHRDVLRAFANCGEVDLYLWAVDRHGPLDDDLKLRDRLRLARRSLLMLWMASRGQFLGGQG